MSELVIQMGLRKEQKGYLSHSYIGVWLVTEYMWKEDWLAGWRPREHRVTITDLAQNKMKSCK